MISKYAIYSGAIPGCAPSTECKDYSALPELWPRSEKTDSPRTRFHTRQYSEATRGERRAAPHASRASASVAVNGQFSGALRYDDLLQLWTLRDLQCPYFGRCRHSRGASGRESDHLIWQRLKYQFHQLALRLQLVIKAERCIRFTEIVGQ